MEFKFDAVNHDKNIPATIKQLDLSSNNRKTELQWHREPEIVFVSDGRAECARNGETRIVEQGDFIIFNSEDVHSVRRADERGCHVMCVNFSFDYIRIFCKAIDSIFFDAGEDAAAAAEISEVLKNISETDTGGDYVPLIMISHINKLYYLLLTRCAHYRRSTGASAVAKKDFSYAKTAIAYINENFRREIPLNEIAGVVNLSPSYFSKYFKSVTQVSFSDYLASLRLEHAVSDMLAYNTTVSTAAFENGFANVKSFITQCKKVYGCTPAQYRKKLMSKKN